MYFNTNYYFLQQHRGGHYLKIFIAATEAKNVIDVYIIFVKIPFCNKSKPRDDKIIVYIFYGLTDIFKLLINSLMHLRKCSYYCIRVPITCTKPFYIKHIRTNLQQLFHYNYTDTIDIGTKYQWLILTTRIPIYLYVVYRDKSL